MNTATIIIKTNVITKQNAQKLANKIGVSLNSVIKSYLKQFLRTKGADMREEPNEYLIKSLKQSNADIKAGRTISFSTNKEALNYIDSLIKDETSRYKKHKYNGRLACAL